MHSFIPSCLNSSLNSVLDSWGSSRFHRRTQKNEKYLLFLPPCKIHLPCKMTSSLRKS
jgi:hypothetical protein